MAAKGSGSRFKPRGLQRGDKTPDGRTIISGAMGAPKPTYNVGSTPVSKEQYNEALNEAKRTTSSSEPTEPSPKLSPEVSQALTTMDEAVIKNRIARQNIAAEKQRTILENEGRRLGIVPEQPVIQPPTVTPPSSASVRATLQESINNDPRPGAEFVPEKARYALGAVGATAKQVFRPTVVLTLLDALTGGGSFREPLTVKMADKAFTELETELNKGIQELADGTGDAATVNKQLQEAADALARLEEFQHDKGLKSVYLRYWLDDGASLETKIGTMRSTVQRLLIEAQAAEQQGNIARTQALLGDVNA